MKIFSQPYSLTAKFDYVLVDKGMVAVVEVKQSGQNFYSLWWVAGLTPEKRLAIAYQAQFAIAIRSPAQATASVEAVAGNIFRVAEESLKSGGVIPIPLMDGHDLPKRLATSFLSAFESQGLFLSQAMELNVSTGLQYEFCQLLRVSKPVEFLAKYLEVPVTTVRQRITWARNKGVLPKQRSVKGEMDA